MKLIITKSFRNKISPSLIENHQRIVNRYVLVYICSQYKNVSFYNLYNTKSKDKTIYSKHLRKQSILQKRLNNINKVKSQ